MVYDLLITGGGPAGYMAAERAGHAGLQTLLVEKKALGGVCLNEGCIPSKTLLHSAKIYDYARFSDKYGVTASDVQYDHAKVIKRKNKVVKALVGGVKAKMKANKVTVVDGEAVIKGRGGEGYEVAVGDEAYTAKRLLIATGSLPIMPPIDGLKPGFDNGFVLTNREILDLETVPKSLVVVGGGVIGMEMASYFNSAGSDVTVIEMLDHIAGPVEPELRDTLLKNYKKAGVTFKLGCQVTKINSDSVVYKSDDGEETIQADKVLMSIGRKPVVTGFGLETIGVELERGAIKVDETCRTNVPEVYAAGDVNGRSMLAHTAYREGEVAVNNMLGQKDRVRYNTIATVIYTNPEVSGIGETEATAKEKGIAYEVRTISMRYSGRYMAENEGGDGICKLLVDKQYNKLLGVHMIGNPSSEIIYGVAPMLETEMRLKDIKELVFPHPTVSEVIREGIFEF